MRSCRLFELAAWGTLLASTAAQAQSVDMIPSLSVAQMYNDNVHFTPTDKVSALASAFDVDLGAALRSERFELQARYGLRSEVYLAPNESLTTPVARHGGELEARATVTPAFTLSGGGAYVDSATAGGVVLGAGVDSGRIRTQSVSAHTGFTVRPGRRSDVHGEYRFSRLSQPDLAANAHSEKLGVSWMSSRRDTLHVDAVAEQVEVADGTVTSVAPMAGWDHALGRQTRISLAAGPRFGSDRVDVGAAASVVHDDRPTRLELGYTRGLATAPGFRDVFVTDSVVARAQGKPLGDVTAVLGVALFRSESPSLLGYAARADFELQLPLADWFRLFSAYRFVGQRLAAEATSDTFQHVVLVGLTLGETAAPKGEARDVAR